MAYIDISLPLHNQTVVWHGDPAVNIQTDAPGIDDVILSKLNLGSHTGTHVDAPRHFLPRGKTVDQIPVERFIGPCSVVTIKTAAPEITLGDLKQSEIRPQSRILFKTKNSRLLESGKFTESYTSLSLEAAEFLADREIWLVGIDYLSIEKFHNPGHPVHKTLLKKEVVILEGLYLEHVTAGNYELYCLPLSLHGLEGAPCRAILKIPNK